MSSTNNALLFKADVTAAIFLGVKDGINAVYAGGDAQWTPVTLSAVAASGMQNPVLMLDGRFGASAAWIKRQDGFIFHVEHGQPFTVGASLTFSVAPSVLSVWSNVVFWASNAPPTKPFPTVYYRRFTITLTASGAVKVNAHVVSINQTMVVSSPFITGALSGGLAIITASAAGKFITEPIFDLNDGSTPNVPDNSADAGGAVAGAIATPTPNVCVTGTGGNKCSVLSLRAVGFNAKILVQLSGSAGSY